MLSENRKTIIWVIAFTFFGLVLRLINLGIEPFWGDEISSVNISRHFSTVTELLQYSGEVDFNPPLYFLLLRSWIHWFGEGQFAVRSLSLIFGAALIPVMYVLAKFFFESSKTAYIAAFLTAVMPMLIEFSQEARTYIMVCFCAAVGMLALWQYLKERENKYLLIYTLANIAGLYFSYSYLFFAVALASWWVLEIIFFQENKSRQAFFFFLAHAAMVFGFAFWLDSFLLKIFLGNEILFGLARSIDASRSSIFFESVSDNLIWVNKFPHNDDRLIVIVKLFFKIAIVFGIVGVFRKMSASMDRERIRSLLFLTWLLVVPLIIFFFSPHSFPYAPIYYRHVIFVVLPLVLLISFVVSNLSLKQGFVLFTILIASLVPSISAVVGNDGLWDHSFKMREAAIYINEHHKTGDLVIVPADVMRSSLAYYLKPEITPITFFPLNYYGLDIWNTRETFGLVEGEYPTRAGTENFSLIPKKLDNLASLYKPKRIWLYEFDYHTRPMVREWFEEREWRHIFKAIDPVFRLDLYAQEQTHALQR